MPKIVDLAGQRFGRLTVVERINEIPGRLSKFWKCLCDCGNTTTVQIANLRPSSSTSSCGCVKQEKLREKNTTHGLSHLPEYGIWNQMLERCYNPKAANYADYGGRGIVVSKEWKESFEAFYHDMGDRPSTDHSLDRKNNDLGYSKENCRWATWIEQASNKRNTVLYEFDGEKKTVRQWCLELNLSYNRVLARLHKGMKFEEALDDVIQTKESEDL